jgi:hypothetical protein
VQSIYRKNSKSESSGPADSTVWSRRNAFPASIAFDSRAPAAGRRMINDTSSPRSSRADFGCQFRDRPSPWPHSLLSLLASDYPVLIYKPPKSSEGGIPVQSKAMPLRSSPSSPLTGVRSSFGAIVHTDFSETLARNSVGNLRNFSRASVLLHLSRGPKRGFGDFCQRATLKHEPGRLAKIARCRPQPRA